MTLKKPKLIPPDLKRCQAEKPNGCTFMSLGGVPRMIRCKNTPEFVAKERKPGKDGRRGSMSICRECLGVMVSQRGPNYAKLTPIYKLKSSQQPRRSVL